MSPSYHWTPRRCFDSSLILLRSPLSRRWCACLWAKSQTSGNHSLVMSQGPGLAWALRPEFRLIPLAAIVPLRLFRVAQRCCSGFCLVVAAPPEAPSWKEPGCSQICSPFRGTVSVVGQTGGWAILQSSKLACEVCYGHKKLLPCRQQKCWRAAKHWNARYALKTVEEKFSSLHCGDQTSCFHILVWVLFLFVFFIKWQKCWPCPCDELATCNIFSSLHRKVCDSSFVKVEVII